VNDTKSRTALVTGATALALARAGFDLAVADLDASWLADVAAEAQGRKVVPIALELRSEGSIEKAVTQAAEALGAMASPALRAVRFTAFRKAASSR